MIPYVTPTDLLGDPVAPASITGPNDQATLGVNFSVISVARLWEMCRIATSTVDTIAAQTLRGDSVYDELSGPGHRLGLINGSVARFVTSRKPLLSVVSGQYAFGSPPWQWNPIPVANIVPEQPPFSDFASASWESADPGQAAFLIGQYCGFGAGHQGTRVGIRYLTGWPVTGILPSVVTTGTFTLSSDVVTVAATTGIAIGSNYIGAPYLAGIALPTSIVVGAPVTASFLPVGTTVTAVSGNSLTLSNVATGSGTATLIVGYAPGSTLINVDDMTTWGLGVRGTIYDGLNTESVNSASVSGAIMTPTPVGPGTITLSTATLLAHLPGVAYSAMPGVIRWATMLAVKVQALERGATAITAQATPGRSSSAGGSAIDRTNKAIATMLLPYRRVF